jgi:hypothetical protein
MRARPLPVIFSGGSCRCGQCSGVGKVSCTTCLSTGKMLVSEHDPRLDPWA